MLKTFLRVLSFSAVLLSGLRSWGQSTIDVLVEHGVAMKTRDGITLRADIYRPSGERTFPVLLQRTPYNKDGVGEFARRAAARGYMVVVQDVRGRYASEGEWYPFKHETQDGFDTIEWVAGLPHSNGKVGMFGGSYVGATQMLAAVSNPPHLAGICPVVTASNYHENWTYQGGAFEQWFNESWTSGLAQDTFSRTLLQGTNARIGSTILPLRKYPLFNLELPANAADLTPKLAPYFLDWLAHPTYDDYWKQWAIDERYASVRVPALTIAAWYDIFQGGSLRNYLGLKAHAGTEQARSGQRLMITIGGHAGGGRKIGSVDFGPAAEDYNENSITLDWYDYLFLDKKNQFSSGKPVRLFVMGENKWRDEESWPPQRAKEQRYFLHSNGKANSASGDGTLSLDAPSSEVSDNYIYDPANPVPSTGGPLCCDPIHLPAGPRDQAELEKRSDMLVYSTPPLTEDMEVTGPVTLDIFAKSSAVDTDFTAKLVDVWPNGFVQNLTEGILRARYRESTSIAKPLVHDTVYEYKIDLWSTSNVFLKGHNIRVEISSSNFPRFDRNLNTGKEASTNAIFIKASNMVYHDGAHASALLLPVVPR